MPKPFLLDDPERAHVLLRCTQEIITNAVRHAQAQILRLRYGWDGNAIRLQARDDGRGAENAGAGNGLAGMRERLAAYGGELEIESAPGQGFTLRLYLPLGQGAPFAARCADGPGRVMVRSGHRQAVPRADGRRPGTRPDLSRDRADLRAGADGASCTAEVPDRPGLPD